jgi:methylated-DNA-[protein]-cysteine S-methyltransferase
MMKQKIIDSPIGPLTAVVRNDELIYLAFAAGLGKLGEKHIGKHFKNEDIVAGDHPVLSATAQQLGQYFSGERKEFDLPLNPHGTEFQKAVWQELLTIPFGKTSSYGELSDRLNSAARAVGAANGQNPIPVIIPCHRVIAADGNLQGFAGGLETKEKLLRHEGVATFVSPKLF